MSKVDLNPENSELDLKIEGYKFEIGTIVTHTYDNCLGVIRRYLTGDRDNNPLDLIDPRNPYYGIEWFLEEHQEGGTLPNEGFEHEGVLRRVTRIYSSDFTYEIEDSLPPKHTEREEKYKEETRKRLKVTLKKIPCRKEGG